MGKSRVVIVFLVFVLVFAVFTQVALGQSSSGPVIESVSPITVDRLQTIVIKGSSFGDTPPRTSSLGDGSVDTIDGGSTPSIQIRNDAVEGGWTAGFQDSNDRNGIGIILVSWSDTEIVLGGFGTALSESGQGMWNIEPGDRMRIMVKVSGKTASYIYTVVEGSQPESGTGVAPVISSVTPITTDRLQTIVINGSGFGDLQPQLMDLGDGSVDTIGGGETPVIRIYNDCWKSWLAGVRDSPTTGWCLIGVILESWSDTQIVLGGFGTALTTSDQYSLNVGDPMRIAVVTSAGRAEYTTTAIEGSNSTFPPASGVPPVISSVTPIVDERLQTITIRGTGFGDVQPQVSYLSDGSVSMVGGGQPLPGEEGTPVMRVQNLPMLGEYWQAGVQDFVSMGSCVIGIFLEKWSDTEIVLGGFGDGLVRCSQWNLNVGDQMRFAVITTEGYTAYRTTVVAGSGTSSNLDSGSTLRTPVLDVFCRSSTSFSNFRVEVSGSLTYDGTGLADVPVLLSYSVNGGNSWNGLTLLNTDGNGDFTAVWMLFVTGNYLLKAEWDGNSNFAETSTEISFSVAPSGEQNLISVASTSKLSSFAFNSTSGQLDFSVNGPSGTTGTVNVYVPKSLITDVFDLQVFLDGEPLSYTVESTGDSWLVTFTYHHSTHEVTVNLTNMQSAPIDVNLFGQLITYGLVILLGAVVAVLLILRKRKRHS